MFYSYNERSEKEIIIAFASRRQVYHFIPVHLGRCVCARFSLSLRAKTFRMKTERALYKYIFYHCVCDVHSQSLFIIPLSVRALVSRPVARSSLSRRRYRSVAFSAAAAKRIIKYLYEKLFHIIIIWHCLLAFYLLLFARSHFRNPLLHSKASCFRHR